MNNLYWASQAQSVVADQVALNSIKYEQSVSGIAPANKNLIIGLAVVSGGFAYYSLSNAVKDKGVGLSNASWNVLSTLSGLSIGYFYWKEDLTKKQILGGGLAIASLYLMNGAE